MLLEKDEIRLAKNLLIAIKRAKFDDFHCDEALALTACFNWLAREIEMNEIVAPPKKEKHGSK